MPRCASLVALPGTVILENAHCCSRLYGEHLRATACHCHFLRVARNLAVPPCACWVLRCMCPACAADAAKLLHHLTRSTGAWSVLEPTERQSSGVWRKLPSLKSWQTIYARNLWLRPAVWLCPSCLWQLLCQSCCFRECRRLCGGLKFRSCQNILATVVRIHWMQYFDIYIYNNIIYIYIYI